ncbi:MAG: biopolymer transporter ExbD [Planctomycetes bacterium]|nr:biopolymer transporter ExbD [Planctomycetota bacterium]MBL7041185.1 biopolymer transporter ExbD [Pirellulaceae bacterium]
MPLKTFQDEQPSPNLTPMIDIVFLLIIFFMVGTKFVDIERKIAVKVPEVTDAVALTPAPEKRVVNVHQDGRISLDRQFVTLDELKSELIAARSQYQDLGVIVRADAEGAFQNVATVLNACTQAGVSVGISVRLGSKDGIMR